MEATGKIIAVMPAQSGVSQRTGNTWMTQQYVLEVPGMYPKRMVFEVFGEDKIKSFNVQQGMEREARRTAAADSAERGINAVAYGR